MTDTCYLCAVGSSRVQVKPRALSTESFGTCTKCSVHACPKHGDRDPKHFRCADCITSSAAQNLVTPDPEIQETIHRHGHYALFAQSPVLALVAARLFNADRTPQMTAALDNLCGYPPGAIDHARHWLEQRLDDLDTAQLTRMVGLDRHEVNELLGQAGDVRETLAEIARAKLEVTFTELDGELSRAEGLRFDRAQASYALAVLAVAFGARDADSLDRSVLDVRGGLYMPAILVLLSTMFVMELQR